MEINEVSVKYTRNNLAEVVDKVSIGKEVFVITRFGKKKAYLIPVEEYETNNGPTSEKKIHRKIKDIKGIWKDRNSFKNRSSLDISRSIREKASSRLDNLQ